MLILAMLITLAAAGSLLVGAAVMGNYLVVRDKLVAADAVAVLSGGGPERLEYATTLINKKYGKKLIFTETGDIDPQNGDKISRTMSKDAIDEGVKKGKQFFAGKDVQNTYEEAKAVLKLSKEHNWESIIVVTDTFHSRRTKIIFSDVFRESDVKIRVVPVDVEDYWYDPNRWWQDSASIRATLSEYGGLISYYLGIYPAE
jgi:uncharacterized SAM-binding protein YcdF (DUF218 family)